MRTESLSREIHAGPQEPPNDIQLLMHSAWLLAGIAIALAACTASDAAPPEPNKNVAHLTPQTTADNGNVQDLTY